jgi:Na+-translocating ferredoxin:NAD+ oxidoreductase subunit G
MITAAHVQKESTIFGIAANLMIAGLLSGLILATINHFTQPIRENNEEFLRLQAMKAVLPKASRFEAIKGVAPGAEWYRGIDTAGQVVGYALLVSTRGYEGQIAMMLGVDASFAIVDFRVLKHRETPGLGAKASEEEFISRFRGRKAGELEVSKGPEPGKVLAITGATITSRAVSNAFEKRLKQLAKLVADNFREIPKELSNRGEHP